MITLALVRPFGNVPHLIRIPYFVLSRFPTSPLMSFSYSYFSVSVLMRKVQWYLVVDPLHEIPLSYCLSCVLLILFSRVFSASINSLTNPVVLHYRGDGLYRDCIAPAIYSDWWSTMDTASGARETSFRAIPQSIKISYCREEFRITSALAKPIWHIPDLIRAIFCSFQISYLRYHSIIRQRIQWV